MSSKSGLSRSEAQKARFLGKPKLPSKYKRKPPTPEQVAAWKLTKQAKRSLTHSSAKRCALCGNFTHICSERTKACSNCGQNVAICVEAKHRKGILCRAATAARALEVRGLVRSFADGLVPMLDEIRVPYELHPTKVVNWSGKGLIIQDEAWVPSEVVAIIQADRPLPERIRALRRLVDARSQKSCLCAGVETTVPMMPSNCKGARVQG